eukprot:5703192-Amphidinium_carterae.2
MDPNALANGRTASMTVRHMLRVMLLAAFMQVVPFIGQCCALTLQDDAMHGEGTEMWEDGSSYKGFQRMM